MKLPIRPPHIESARQRKGRKSMRVNSQAVRRYVCHFRTNVIADTYCMTDLYASRAPKVRQACGSRRRRFTECISIGATKQITTLYHYSSVISKDAASRFSEQTYLRGTWKDSTTYLVPLHQPRTLNPDAPPAQHQQRSPTLPHPASSAPAYPNILLSPNQWPIPPTAQCLSAPLSTIPLL